MQLVVLKYLQIICVTVFFSNNIICDNVAVDREQRNINKISACAAAKCLNNVTLGNNLQECYDECMDNVEDIRELKNLRTSKDVTYNLWCRNSSWIVLKVNTAELTDNLNRSLVYLVNVHGTKEPYYQTIYLTNDSIIEIKNLTAGMSYNVTVTIVTSNFEVKKLGRKIVTTLIEDYIPGNITKINTTFQLEPNDNYSLSAIVYWRPAKDATCLYHVLYHSQKHHESIGMIELDKYSDFYRYQLPYKLTFDHDYSIAVRGVNTKNQSLEGYAGWKVFRTPTCLEIHRSLDICEPEQILEEEIFRNETYLDNHHYKLEISWVPQEYKPSNYTIKILDFENFYDSRIAGEKTIDGSLNSVTFPSIELRGSFYDIEIFASANGGNTTSGKEHNTIINKMPHSARQSIAAIYIFFSFSIIMILLIFFIYKRRMDLKKIEEIQMQSLETLLRKSKLENFNELFAIHNDPLEIPRNKIMVSEQLGEGAFGVVKKGYLENSDGSVGDLVAIKMLKENAGFTDIRQFRLEIDMMKSVKRHPNILSIIGHCTKKIEELMLITEYCDRGNLLDFLRFEWHRRYEIAFPMSKLKHPESVFNLDINFSKKATSYKNFCQSPKATAKPYIFEKLFRANFDTNNNSPIEKKFKSICAVNPLYLENDVLVEVSSEDILKDIPMYLDVEDLMSIAIQVADGMHFLSKNKIVHRDLAARNVSFSYSLWQKFIELSERFPFSFKINI
jgi:tyrosine-protein kinase receptor torso